MIFLAKVTLYFFVSFFLLCVPINKSPLFFHLYRLGGKHVEQSISDIKKEIVIKIEEGTDFGKKFFNGSLPNISVDGQRLQIEKNKDHYTDQERELLKRVFNN